MKRLAVLADTHVVSGIAARLPFGALAAIEWADLVVHAGDITGAEAFEELADMTSLVAVLGNNDHELAARLPETRLLEIEGLRLGVIHDSGPSSGRAKRLHQRFEHCDVVVFGHSHVPCDEIGVDGQRLFNPGSPTQRRSQPEHTVGRLVIDGGILVEHHIDRV